MAETSTNQAAQWDTAYERRVIPLLAVAFALVGPDRGVLPPLFAAGMGADLHLTNANLGMLTGVLGLAWGVSALVFGGVSDRLGRRRVLTPRHCTVLAVFNALRRGRDTHRVGRGEGVDGPGRRPSCFGWQCRRRRGVASQAAWSQQRHLSVRHGNGHGGAGADPGHPAVAGNVLAACFYGGWHSGERRQLELPVDGRSN